MDIIKPNKMHIPDLLMLNSFVQDIHAEQHPEQFKPIDQVQKEAGYFFEKIIKTENQTIFAAYIDNNAVGYIWFSMDEVPENPFKYGRKQIYIHQLVVHDQYRQRCVGTSLVQKVEGIATLNNIEHLELDSWAFNTGAHTFFEKHGFQAFNIKMWKN